MRLAILFLIGVAIGAACATMVVNTLRQRDAYARGTMAVMQHHYASLREALRLQHCDPVRTGHALAQLRALSAEIEPSIYADSIPDAPFREFNDRLRDALAATPAPAPAACVDLAPFVQKIGKTCDDCHQQYR